MKLYNRSKENEIKKFYTLLCEVFTAFHNYATAKRLFQTKVYSWSIVAYYYSLMHCGHAICFMSLNCFPKTHKGLYKLLSGKKIKDKFWKLENPEGVDESHDFEQLIDGFYVIVGHIDESKIKKIGDYLKGIKDIREFNNYEMFIVAHQIEHQDLSPALMDGNQNISQIVKEYLIFITDLLFRYTERKGDDFKAFILDKNRKYKWAFEYLKESLKQQKFNNAIIEEIEKIIKDNLLNKISVQTSCPDEFYRPISRTFFDAKSRIIGNFIKAIRDLD